MLALSLGLTTGCATTSKVALPTLEPQWTREELQSRAWVWSCDSKCRTELRSPHGPIVVSARTDTYGLHEVRGWNTGSTAGRVVGGILGGVVRRQGLSTDNVQVGHGTRTVTDSAATPWELRCRVYWIDDQVEEYNRSEMDHVARSTRRSEGAHCRVVDMADTTNATWRLRAGIAPARDSLAATYDSVSAVSPQEVSANPPMLLERMGSAAELTQRYTIDREPPARFTLSGVPARRSRVMRSDSTAVGVIHTAPQGTAFDIAPGATPEEIRVLRLVAALLAVSFKGA